MAHLREFTAGDFEALFAIDQACFPHGVSYSRRTLRMFLAFPGADCVVAEHNAEIIAFILTAADGKRGQIITLDVRQTHRRSGVGSALLREAESRLQVAGVHRISLETATDNEAAVAFWHKHGYRTEAVLKNYYLGKLDAFQMLKSLPAQAHKGSSKLRRSVE